jgi:hypothetical protein
MFHPFDDLMVVDRFVPKIDKWMKHYDETAVYADEMANALGLAMDVNNFHEALIGARISTPLVDGNVDAIGLVITNDKFKLTGAGPGAVNDVELAEAIRGAVKQAATSFKQKRVPDAIEKVCYLNWEDYYTILNAVDTNGFSLFNKDYASGNIVAGVCGDAIDDKSAVGRLLVPLKRIPKRGGNMPDSMLPEA